MGTLEPDPACFLGWVGGCHGAGTVGLVRRLVWVCMKVGSLWWCTLGGMEREPVVRVQVLLRQSEIDYLDRVAGKLGVSRSYLLRQLVGLLEDDLDDDD